jgi:hypothetical protein
MASEFDDIARLKMLQPPTGRIDMVLDTDTYNEVDDQFAVAWALLEPDRLNVEAIYAAPFHNTRSSGPADGMEKSYDEILRLLELLKVDPEGLVHKGATQWIEKPDVPVDNAAARDLVQRAMADRPGPLYVLAVGAITNVASAILMEPKIIERIVVVWLGGQSHGWHTASEFNLKQDPHASRLMFDCGVPLVHIPCLNVAVHLRTTVPELDACLAGRSAIGDYLVDIVRGYHDDHFCWSKVIWDIATVAWVLNADWIPTRVVHAPVLTDQLTWSRDDSRPLIRVGWHCRRDEIYRRLFTRLAETS